MVSPVSRATATPLQMILPRLRRAIIGIGVVSTGLNVLLLSGSIYMMMVYDLVLPGRSEATLAGLLMLVIAAYAFQAVLDILRSRILVNMASNVDAELQDRAHGLIGVLSRTKPATDAAQPIRDLDQVRSFLSSSAPVAFVDLPWVLFFVAILFLLHPAIGVTVLIGAILLVGLTVLTEKVTSPGTERLVQLSRSRHMVVEASRRHADAIYAMGMEHRLRGLFHSANRTYLAAHTRLAGSSGTLGNIGKVFRMLLQSVVLTVGALLVLEGKASGGVIFASSILSSRALAPIELVIANWRGFVAARQSWSRLKQAFATGQERVPAQALPPPSKRLAVESLSLCPPGSDTPTVRQVSLVAFAGEALAILGPSGCGKSTLLRGIAGVLPPLSGDVRLDGATLDQWPRDVLGQHIGYLPQNVELLSGTVAQNIARFEPNAPAELIIAAARHADVHDMIQHLPDGYNTDVGDDGRRLSAGQRQRIALARALYRDPFLILLDEPNSNLDPVGEAALVEAVRAATARKALVVVVAHRPSILVAIENVMLMRDGRAEAYGPKASLIPHLLGSEPKQIVDAAPVP